MAQSYLTAIYLYKLEKKLYLVNAAASILCCEVLLPILKFCSPKHHLFDPYMAVKRKTMNVSFW